MKKDALSVHAVLIVSVDKKKIRIPPFLSVRAI